MFHRHFGSPGGGGFQARGVWRNADGEQSLYGHNGRGEEAEEDIDKARLRPDSAAFMDVMTEANRTSTEETKKTKVESERLVSNISWLLCCCTWLMFGCFGWKVVNSHFMDT